MAMERATILENLGLAERHIGAGEHQLRLQRELIDRLHREGQDATEAEVLLKSSEQTQKLHFADRSRLLRELAADSDQRHSGGRTVLAQVLREDSQERAVSNGPSREG